jgi:uncharacterized protein
MKTTFDPAKRDWTLAHRGLDFAVDAEKVFSGDTVTAIDGRVDYGEVRQISAGFQRGTSRHIISMRYCHGKEEKRWNKILRQAADQ